MCRMKLELEILKEVFKKNAVWLILYISFVILQVILILLRSSIIPIQVEDFLSLIGDPMYYDYTFHTTLLKLFQICLIVYYVFQINSYEYQFSLENFLLRLNEKHWIRIKILISILLFLFLKSIFIFIVYAFFCKDFSIQFSYFYPSILYDLLVVLLMITFTNFLIKNNLSLLMFFVIIFSYFFLIIFHWKLILFISILLIIINLYLFRFKRVINE